MTKFVETELPGVIIVEPRVFGDERGFFLESYNRRLFSEAGIEPEFVQDNHSRSAKGVLRGLHYQVRKPQAKLVRVARGAVLDVAVDVRPDSSTFKRWVAVELSASNHRQLFVPAGFAHGFCALEDDTELLYKCTDFYDPGGEGGVIWDDPEIGIEWPIADPTLSDKDAQLPRLERAWLPGQDAPT